MCDTMVRLGDDGVLFAKNSDRDPNESQLLEWRAAADHAEGSFVECTSLAIPQVAHTHAVLLSRPWWMWGAEIGANEHGVVIGNEAVFTRAPVDEDGLRGMDLLRLALERARTADEAAQVLVSLVEAHGQGGRCGLEDPSFRYHNSFLVADARGAVVVETVGRRTATERVTSGVRAISNVLTIPGFAETWSDQLKTTVAAGRTRRARTTACATGATGVADLIRVLSDHGAPGGPRYAFLNGTLNAPCMHGGGAVASSVSAASWVADLRPEAAAHWVTASSAPCLALFKPVRVTEPLALGPAPGATRDASRWWRFERLHRAWLRNPDALGPRFLPERDAVQARWLADPPDPEQAFAEEDALLARWLPAVEDPTVPETRPWWARRYWSRREREASPA